ncbi:HK97-gp10 family putative phage morphogenesis protein [Paraburkholderia adhaesiva]|uniref:HK97-gp10 family putative phage morphogenesis protein n=1 Tax=Paraburkholderia adhaesiva TaxID=2883244 RepID=UPI001F436CBE|nr:HK97-gp10 family putative phage morphogenesis protein [Paraburkholderia adhaesiva]
MIEIREVQGLSELERFLKQMPAEMATRMLGAALRSAGKPMLEEIRRNVLEQFGSSADYTGELHDAILSRANRRTQYAKRIDVTVRARRVKGGRVKRGPSAYGRYLEYGTSKMRAHPFFNPGITAKTPEAINAFRKTLRASVKRWCQKNNVRFEERGT